MPVLKEIDFDVIYKASYTVTKQYEKLYNCSEQEAKKIEKYLKIYLTSEFKYYVRSTCALYERFLPKIKDDCWKIIFKCVTDKIKNDSEYLINAYGQKVIDINDEGLGYPRFCDIYDVYIWYTDFYDFFYLSDIDKKKKVLELIDYGINDLLKYKKNWDRAPFDYAHDMVVKNNYDNSYIFGKRALNRNTGYKAELFCEHLTFTFNAYIVVRNAKKEIIKKKLVLSDKPDEINFHYKLGELIWDDDKTIRIKRKYIEKDILVYMEELV